MPASAHLYTISQAAQLLGVSADTLRRWEEENLYQPERTPGGQRRYDVNALKKLRGFTRRWRGRKQLPTAAEIQISLPPSISDFAQVPHPIC